MFKMIRCGANFCLVIMVSPAEAEPEDLDAKFYRYATWQIDDHQPGIFNEISRSLALSYFSGNADGLGFEPRPAENFPTLEAAVEYINTHQKPTAGDKTDDELRAELRDLLTAQGVGCSDQKA